MTDKLRKYVLPNIPYVFIGWAFLKLGTAYRLAAGGDFAHIWKCTVRYCSMSWCYPTSSLSIAPRLTKRHETAWS